MFPLSAQTNRPGPSLQKHVDNLPPEVPAGQFVYALSSGPENPAPRGSIAIIEKQAGGEYVLRIRDWHHGPKVVPIRFRQVKTNNHEVVLAFDGSVETKDPEGGSEVYLFRVAGVASRDGSLDATMWGFMPPGFMGSARESVTVRSFKMRPLAAESGPGE